MPPGPSPAHAMPARHRLGAPDAVVEEQRPAAKDPADDAYDPERSSVPYSCRALGPDLCGPGARTGTRGP